jgi:hypothetical protein
MARPKRALGALHFDHGFVVNGAHEHAFRRAVLARPRCDDLARIGRDFKNRVVYFGNDAAMFSELRLSDRKTNTRLGT